jgi:hypothetical protein
LWDKDFLVAEPDSDFHHRINKTLRQNVLRGHPCLDCSSCELVRTFLAAEIGPDETGTVALTAVGVASDLVPNTSTQTAAVSVAEGLRQTFESLRARPTDTPGAALVAGATA